MIGLGKRISYSVRCFFSILFRSEIPQSIASDMAKSPATVGIMAKTPEPGAAGKASESFDRAIQMLALLQRDGRLIDFLVEDVSPYPDAQLGAAVRSVHESTRKVLERYVRLEPIIESDEDSPVTVQAGFDPASIKVIGNATGNPPLRGVLRHRGWRAAEVHLPSLPEGPGRAVIAPAEVEVP